MIIIITVYLCVFETVAVVKRNVSVGEAVRAAEITAEITATVNTSLMMMRLITSVVMTTQHQQQQEQQQLTREFTVFDGRT